MPNDMESFGNTAHVKNYSPRPIKQTLGPQPHYYMASSTWSSNSCNAKLELASSTQLRTIFRSSSRHCPHAGPLNSFAISGATSRSCGGSGSLLANPSSSWRCRPRMRYATPHHQSSTMVSLTRRCKSRWSHKSSPSRLVRSRWGARFVLSYRMTKKACNRDVRPVEHVLHASAFDSESVSSHQHEALRYARRALS
ncbi:hypothetical protein IQ06DRAFT_292588 [Phaeosphaeriaceae sp. SRC1lsM3a]|nr:hypothetical protein IQ06DRAFT_292588 [Stagonospora sp. SRC1lsM3a]